MVFDFVYFLLLVFLDEKSEVKGLKLVVFFVDFNYFLLFFYFVVDFGEDFLWSKLDNDIDIVEILFLNVEKRFELLKSYLDVEILKVLVIGNIKKEVLDDVKLIGKFVEVNGDIGNKLVEKKLFLKLVGKKEKLWIVI